MEGYKIRLFEEQDCLANKVDKIEKFMITEEFHKLNFKLRWLTKLQSYHMHLYFKYLKKRMSILCSIEDVEEYANMVYAKEQEEDKKKEEKPKKDKKRKTTKKEKKDA